MKLIHTSDWQIGMRAKHVASASEAVRQARIDSARKVVALASEHKADGLLIAGDLFEDNQVENRWVHQVVDTLSQAECPVYVLPGNHDPLNAESIFRRASWKAAPAHIHLIESSNPIELSHGAGLLLPSPLSQKRSAEDPSDRIMAPERAKQPNEIWIGLTHGSLAIEGKHQKDDFPIRLNACEMHQLDYLALGHWHSRFESKGASYCGTHEPTHWSETGAGQVLLLNAEGNQLSVQPLSTQQLYWRKWAPQIQIQNEEQIELFFKSARAEWESWFKDLPMQSKAVLKISWQGSVRASQSWTADENKKSPVAPSFEQDFFGAEGSNGTLQVVFEEKKKKWLESFFQDFGDRTLDLQQDSSTRFTARNIPWQNYPFLHERRTEIAALHPQATEWLEQWISEVEEKSS